MPCFRPILASVLGIALPYVMLISAVQAKINYGLWAITVQTSMEGIPVELPTETIRKCIRSDDLTPGNNKNRAGCKPVKIKRKGDTINWAVSCNKDGHTLKGSGKITYKGNSMKGGGQFHAGGKGLPNMKMKLLYKGKRLGDCRD